LGVRNAFISLAQDSQSLAGDSDGQVDWAHLCPGGDTAWDCDYLALGSFYTEDRYAQSGDLPKPGKVLGSRCSHHSHFLWPFRRREDIDVPVSTEVLNCRDSLNSWNPPLLSGGWDCPD
jgi:hypothetical protein